MRGPGWNFFMPWEYWDSHKVVALTSVDLPYLLGFRDYWAQAAVGGLFIVGLYAVIPIWYYFRTLEKT